MDTETATNAQVQRWEQVPLDRRMLHVMERLIDHYGYAVGGAAGLVGNLDAKSGVIPSRIEGSRVETPMRSKNFNGQVLDHTPQDVMRRNPAAKIGPLRPGVGLAQWTFRTRRAGLFAHTFNGVKLGAAILFDLDAQIDYLVHELRSQFHGVQAKLVDAHTTVDVACDEVVYNFEIPGALLSNGSKLPRSDARVQKVFAQRRPLAARAHRAYREAHP